MLACSTMSGESRKRCGFGCCACWSSNKLDVKSGAVGQQELIVAQEPALEAGMERIRRQIMSGEA
jgi:hypothetical protein